METHILEEVEKLCDQLDIDGDQGNKPIDLTQRMNISIVNALWVLLVGEKLELNDKRLKVFLSITISHFLFTIVSFFSNWYWL